MFVSRALCGLALVACSRSADAPPSVATNASRPSSVVRSQAPTASASAEPAPPVASAAVAPAEAAASAEVVNLIEVAKADQQWTGIAVAGTDRERVFVSYPRWSEYVPVSVEELSFVVVTNARGSRPSTECSPYPNEEWNTWNLNRDPRKHFVAVQSVVATKEGTLWVLDTGNPRFRGVVPGAPKLVAIDLGTNKVRAVIPFEPSIANGASYLNDVRFDLPRSTAYLSDSGKGGLIVLDLTTKKSRRVLDDSPSTHAEDTDLTIEGSVWRRPDGSKPKVHADGIALSPDREWLYYQALTGRTLYRVPTAALRDAKISRAELSRAVQVVGTPGPADGLEATEAGIIHTSLEANALSLVRPDGSTKVLVQDPRLSWPDSLAFGQDGELWLTTSLIHRGPNPGTPYGLWRVPHSLIEAAR